MWTGIALTKVPYNTLFCEWNFIVRNRLPKPTNYSHSGEDFLILISTNNSKCVFFIRFRRCAKLFWNQLWARNKSRQTNINWFFLIWVLQLLPFLLFNAWLKLNLIFIWTCFVLIDKIIRTSQFSFGLKL